VQEALTNVIKHANASTVEISIAELQDRVDVRIADNGVGVGPGATRTEGFGLIGIQERLELVGGTFALEPGEAGGTELRAAIPVSRSTEEAPQSA